MLRRWDGGKMSTAVWKLIPKKQIGEIEFGADKKNVRKADYPRWDEKTP